MENKKLTYLVIYMTYAGKELQRTRSLIYECDKYIDSKEEFEKLKKYVKDRGTDCRGLNIFYITDFKLLTRE